MPDGSGPALPLIIALAIFILIALSAFVVVRGRRRAPRAPKAPPRLPPKAPPARPPQVPEATAPPAPPAEAPPEAPTLEAPPAEAPPVEAPPAPAEAPPAEAPPAPPAEAPPIEAPPAPPKRRVRGIGAGLARLFRGGALSAEEWEDLEEVLLRADVGVAATDRIVGALKARKGIDDGRAAVRAELIAALGGSDRSLTRRSDGLTVWLVTGVNGTGKTTTIGKLAAQLKREGATSVLAAADTFRAAADQQLEIWADRAGAVIVKGAPGGDPASVVFDGVKAARERSADVLIVDTAGRLQTKRTLMDELGKIARVLEREAGKPDESLLVIDATTGQNGVQQARAFAEAVGLTGIALTKLDGTAKGGIVIAVQQELGIPVKLVGLGEGIDDLAPFDPEAFVDDLLAP